MKFLKLALALALFSTAFQTAAAAQPTLDGTYMSTFASGEETFLTEITFATTPEGIVTGTYTYEGREAPGALSDIKLGLDNIATATWEEDGVTGRVRFTFEDDTLQYFVGTWGFGDSDTDGGWWNGKHL